MQPFWWGSTCSSFEAPCVRTQWHSVCSLLGLGLSSSVQLAGDLPKMWQWNHEGRLFWTFCGIFRVHRDFLILILHQQINCPWNSWKQAFPVSPKGPNRSNPSKLGAQQLYQPTFLPRYNFFRPFWCGLFVFCWQQLQMLRCSLLDNRYCPPSQVFNHRIVSCGKFRYRALRGYWLPKLPKSEKGNKDNHELFGRGGRGDRSKGKSCQVRLPSPGRWDVRRAKDRKKERRSGTKFLRFFKFVLLDWVEWVCPHVALLARCDMWNLKLLQPVTCPGGSWKVSLQKFSSNITTNQSATQRRKTWSSKQRCVCGDLCIFGERTVDLCLVFNIFIAP